MGPRLRPSGGPPGARKPPEPVDHEEFDRDWPRLSVVQEAPAELLQILLAERLSTVKFRPNRFVESRTTRKPSYRRSARTRSQVDRMASLQDDVIVAPARYWGRYAGHALAEPMRIVRQRDSEMKPDIANAA